MIEDMIAQVQKYLPLKILEIQWDETLLQMHGEKWNFTTLSAWRISINNKMIYGCFDENSLTQIESLKGADIIKVNLQNSFLKIDPVFILSNNQILEVFSTDTYEPWTFQFDE